MLPFCFGLVHLQHTPCCLVHTPPLCSVLHFSTSPSRVTSSRYHRSFVDFCPHKNRSLLSIPPSSNVAPTIDLTCPFAVEALQLRLLGRLHLGAFDTALMDAKKLQKTRWILLKDERMGWSDGGNDGMVTSKDKEDLCGRCEG